MDRFGLAFIERLSCFDWLRWVVGVNTKKMVVDEVAGVNAEIMVVDKVARVNAEIMVVNEVAGVNA